MCGIFGIFGGKDIEKKMYLGLFALQHRGQEAAGVTLSNNKDLFTHKGIGLVSEVFKGKDFSNTKGIIAGIGHVRYSTAGESNIENAQPLTITSALGKISIAHNGNLTNAKELREKLEQQGCIFRTSSDTEIILQLMARSCYSNNIYEAIIDSLLQIKGAYSLLILTPNKLIGIKDPLGFRPLCLGKLEDAYVISSETAALDLIGAEYIRELEPGEIIIISDNTIEKTSKIPINRQEKLFHSFDININKSFQHKAAQCIFEYIYFARPDSIVFKENVYLIREKLGERLAKEHPIEVDVVIPIPDSGVPAALGYAKTLNLPYQLGLIRNLYTGRTFIHPEQMIREYAVQMKLNPIKEIIKDKRIALMDDSVVRGTTCKKIVAQIRQYKPKELHLLVASPPIKYPCYFGIDTPTQKELIAANKSIPEITQFIGADSIRYLSLEGLLSVVKDPSEFCVACFNGDYPI